MSDPLAANVVLLLPFDNSPSKGTYLDRSAYRHPVAPLYDIALSKTQARYGQWSVQTGAFDREGYLELPNNALFSFGALDFCIEAWVYPQAGGGTFRTVVAKYLTSGNQRSWSLCITSAGHVAAYCSNDGAALAVSIQVATPVLNDQWYHVALTREGASFRLFVNGVLGASATTTVPLYVNTLPVTIGGGSGGRWLKGFLDGVRITRGAARYTADFDPLTTEFEWVEVPENPKQARGALVREGIFTDLSLRDPNPLTRQMRNGRYAPVVGSARRILGRNAALPHREGRLGCQIAGTVAIKGELQNPPVSRPVSLYAHGSDRLIAQTRSDAQGHYRFDGLDPAQRYFVVAFDTDKHYRAVVADNLAPEMLP